MAFPGFAIHRGYTVRHYLWKGASCAALYSGNRRMGVISATEEEAQKLAEGLGGRYVSVGEVRDGPSIMVTEVIAFEPREWVKTEAKEEPGWDGR